MKTFWPTPYDEDQYQQLVSTLTKDNKEDVSEKLFSMRCQYFREQRPDQIDDLLFMPVGNQVQGPILTCLANPARQVVLLHTGETKGQAEQIKSTLQDENDFHLKRIDYLDWIGMLDLVEDCYSIFNQPERTVCDLTSGRKPASCIMAGLASLNGWKAVYLDNSSREGIFINERLVQFPNLFERGASAHQMAAEQCLKHGAITAAMAEYQTVLEHSLAGRRWAEKLANLECAKRLRDGNLEALLQEPVGFTSDQLQLLQELKNDPKPLYYWSARCHHAEGNPLAIEALNARLGMDWTEYGQHNEAKVDRFSFLWTQLKEQL
jgi:hypothetical protein